MAVFALGPVTDPYKEEEWQGARAQLAKELAKVPWLKPAALEIFGGRLDPQKLGFPMKLFAGADAGQRYRRSGGGARLGGKSAGDFGSGDAWLASLVE